MYNAADATDATMQEVPTAPPFGIWLKERRKAHDLTQEELADRVGCSRDTIRKIELGQRRPSRQVAELLAADLGVPSTQWPTFVRWARTEGTAQLRTPNSPPRSPMEANGTGEGALPRFPTAGNISTTGPSLINPYKGLRPFFESDAADFFGREALVDQLFSRLSDQGEGEYLHFLAVIGASGSGKSSVVRAGLIPRIRSAGLPGGLRPIVADCTPGAQPARQVKAALLRSISTAMLPVDGQSSIQLPSDNDPDLLTTIQHLSAQPEDTGLLLLIDQFEEVFTLVPAEADRARFLRGLYSAASEGGQHNRLWVVVTLRADFYDRPLAYPDFSRMLAKRTEVVTPMTRAELRRAIVSPAERVGLELEEHLVDSIEQDVGEQPGTLPLMEYALSELFERRTGRLLTLQAYIGSGGVEAALVRRAEAIYAQLTSREQREATQLFLRLVSVGEGAEYTRRRVLRSELVSAASDEEALDQVLDAFGEYRLLTFDRDQRSGRPTVEVAHEALLTAWTRLREWLEVATADLQVHRRMMAAALDWEQTGHDPSYLASGARLAQFETLAAQSELSFTSEEQTYLRASLTARERERLQQEGRRRRTIGGLVAGLVLMATLTFVALVQSLQASEQRDNAMASASARATAQAFAEAQTREAQEQQRLALSRELAMDSQAELAANPNLSLLLAIEAAKLSHTQQTEDTLRQALVETQPHTILRYPGGDSVNSASFSADGKLVVTAGSIATRIWEVGDRTGNSGNLVAELPNLRGDLPAFMGIPAGVSAAVSPDGKQVVVVTRDLVPVVWDIAKQAVSAQLVGHSNVVNSAEFSPDGKLIATASNDKTARIWDAATGKSLFTLTVNSGIVNDAQFSLDGSRIVTSSDDNTARVWDVSSGRLLLTLSGHSDWVNAASFSPDGKLIVTGSNDRTARIWDAATGKSLLQLTGHMDVVNSARFSPDGKMVATGSDDGTARMWDARSGQLLAEIDSAKVAPASRVENAAGHFRIGGFSPDGRRLLIVTSGSDAAARIYPWNLFTPIDDLLPLASSLAPRQLTCDERRIYLHETAPCPTLAP